MNETWPLPASFKLSYLMVSRWLKENESILAQESQNRNPEIIYAYMVDAPFHKPLDLFKSVTDFFSEERLRPSNQYNGASNKTSALHAIHEGILRSQQNATLLLELLAVALKAHYFLYANSVLKDVPSVFTIPNLLNPNETQIGLYYPLSGDKTKSIWVSKYDLAVLVPNKMALTRFPVIMTKDYFDWLSLEHWKGLSHEALDLRELLLDADQKESDAVKSYKDRATFPYGTVLDIPPALESIMKQCGVRWAQGIKAFYLPKGYDLKPVKAFLDYQIEQLVQLNSF